MASLRRFEVAGEPRAMGQAFGEHFRGEVRELAELRIAHLSRFVAGYDLARGLGRAEAVELAAKTVEAHRRYCPAIWEEFAGIAGAANMSDAELLIGNGYTDYRDYALAEARGESPDEHTGECTALIVPGPSAGGSPIVGQTWDMDADARVFLVLLHRRPVAGPETLALTTAGCLCLIGMNSAGVSVGNTNLVASDARVGVNYLFTITRALQCESAGQAADVIEATPRLSGHNFYAVDRSSAINVETSATEARRTVVDAEPFVHTNHFLSERLEPFEMARNQAGSRWRYRRMSAGLASLEAPITVDDCWSLLADNTRGDGAICNEDYEGKFGSAATLATIVQHPATRTIHICEGGARLGQREIVTF